MPKISWEQFSAYNPDPKKSFEDLCRALFSREFLDGAQITHANPNNPGVEIEPVMEKDSGKMISFQAKHFSNSVKYSDILESMEQTVSHYSGQLDVVYLYCNKDINVRTTTYQKAKKVLNDAGIELSLITGDCLLQQVRRYGDLGLLYFSQNYLSQEWFQEQLDASLDALGRRYNGLFNIETGVERLFNLFIRDEKAVDWINLKLTDALKEIQYRRSEYSDYGEFLTNVSRFIYSIPRITKENILDSLSWAEEIQQHFAEDFNSLMEKRRSLEDQIAEIDFSAMGNNTYRELNQEFMRIDWLVSIPELVKFNRNEEIILSNQTLIITGESGTGKSQLLSNSAKQIVDSKQYAILLLGQYFNSSDPIHKQIMDYFDIDYSFEEFLGVLNAIGEKSNEFVFIFVDAINESTDNKIWQHGLPQIIKKIEKYTYLKLAVSLRSEYEPLFLPDTVVKRVNEGSISRLVHSGLFEDSPRAIQDFLNRYGIPFAPSCYLHYEMSNPLFLTLFCNTYNGEEVDMYTLLDRIVEQADKEAKASIGFDGTNKLLIHLLEQIADYQLENNQNYISQNEFLKLPFWNDFGINKMPFLAALQRFGIINTMYLKIKDQECYTFAYNLLEDFICAKRIVGKFPEKDALKEYLRHDLLKIEENEIKSYQNCEIFWVVCGLYAEKYHEECIDVIDGVNTYTRDLHRSYIHSFLWRNGNSVNKDYFISFCKSNNVAFSEVADVLIESATKRNHPLNALFLHEILMSKQLNVRDASWTIFINGIYANQARIGYLIDYIVECGELKDLEEENAYLLLVLLVWLFSSSNRRLRDMASKAAIELLKKHFSICEKLLIVFETVNDPYIKQRLYGIVFGACVKRDAKQKSIFQSLACYVYRSVFDQDVVYLDILLRDYAKLIIERFLFEFPEEGDMVDVSKIAPPYRSFEIPQVEQQSYSPDDTARNGFRTIERSMQLNQVKGLSGWYGDFGRYIFQSAISRFSDVDLLNLYHYAMQYIRDQLGYDDKLFGKYDTSSLVGNYDRHYLKKTERIGKKYQWIVFFHILALLSDTHSLDNWGEDSEPYKGLWQLGVRDFDPTFNSYSMCKPKTPVFCNQEEWSIDFISEDADEPAIIEWCSNEIPFFKERVSHLTQQDEDEVYWLSLYQYEEYKHQSKNEHDEVLGISKGMQEVWVKACAWFVSNEEVNSVIEAMSKQGIKRINSSHTFSLYEIYNREYAWSSDCHDISSEFYVEVMINSDDMITEQSIQEDAEFHDVVDERVHDDADEYTKLIIQYAGLEDDETEDLIITVPLNINRPTEVSVGTLYPTHVDYVWESQYDASQEETQSFMMPIKELINFYHLEQKMNDGYFYDPDGILVAFDGEFADLGRRMLIRKDYIDRFLAETNRAMLWLCIGEKQYFTGHSSQKWSEWEALYSLRNGTVEEVFKKLHVGA